MDEKLAAALAKRLAAYSATAGVALAVAPEAGAQVVYHDFEPDYNLGVLRLDLDDDGTHDLLLRFTLCSGYGDCPRAQYYALSFRVPAAGGAQNGVLGYGAPNPPYWLPQAGVASRLEEGDVIGQGGPASNFYRSGFVALAVGGQPQYGWEGEGYAGFRFVGGDGALRYGWVRLGVTPYGPERVLDYAYETSPETPIEAGARAAATIGGTVNQTVFPASGGTLRYTFTVQNNTDTLLPLDLWLKAERRGGGSATRRLGSGTLPPGATVARAVSVPVRPGAPPGTYDVTFAVGDLDGAGRVASQSFVILKEASTEAPAGGDGEAFAVAPVAGDLFASAEATVELTATHALTAPTPNPTTGQSEVTLQVAEAQHVSVTVHDALGRRVAVLHDGVLAAGAEHRLVFDGSDLPAGVYVVRAVGERFADARVLTLAR